jgi:DNA-binding NarL/FixJ family response regulator
MVNTARGLHMMRSVGTRGRPTAVLTDDHAAVLATVCKILEEEFEIVASVMDGEHALEAVIRFRPDLIVLDIAMPGWDGFETALRIAEVSPTTRVLFLTVYEDVDYMDKARQLSAGCVIKRRMQSDLLPAAREALAGKLFFSELQGKLS